jgi:hypothetical protein
MRHRPKLHLDADALPRDGHHARFGELRRSRRGNPLGGFAVLIVTAHYFFPNSTGNFATFAAIRHASLTPAAARRST